MKCCPSVLDTGFVVYNLHGSCISFMTSSIAQNRWNFWRLCRRQSQGFCVFMCLHCRSKLKLLNTFSVHCYFSRCNKINWDIYFHVVCLEQLCFKLSVIHSGCTLNNFIFLLTQIISNWNDYFAAYLCLLQCNFVLKEGKIKQIYTKVQLRGNIKHPTSSLQRYTADEGGKITFLGLGWNSGDHDLFLSFVIYILCCLEKNILFQMKNVLLKRISGLHSMYIFPLLKR